MDVAKSLKVENDVLQGRVVVVTGATGGLGKEICSHLCALGAQVVALGRNQAKLQNLVDVLKRNYPTSTVQTLACDFEDLSSVKTACTTLSQTSIDALILNAGAYAIARKQTVDGFDNVFQINCVAPYLMTKLLLPTLEKSSLGRVVAVSSLAHTFTKIKGDDLQFQNCNNAEKVYGNAKRHLTLSLFALFDGKPNRLSITHPGITPTGITSHYPKWLQTLIKLPMKLIFSSPKKASLCIIKGVFTPCEFGEWIGPRIFKIWGKPKKSKIKGYVVGELQTASSFVERAVLNI